MAIIYRKSELDINVASLLPQSSSGLLVNRNTTASAKKAKTKRRKRMRSNQIAFTQVWVDRLEAPTARKVFYDTKVKYLMLEVMPTGTKVYRFQRVRKGKRQLTTIGKATDVTLESARDKAQLLSADTVRGADFSNQRREERAELTLGELFENYHSVHSDSNCTTGEELRKETNRYWGTLLHMRVSQVDEFMLEVHVNRISQKGKHPHKANKAINGIKAAWQWCFSRNLVKNNPTLQLKTIKTKTRTRIVEPEEFNAIFAAITAYPDVRIRDFFFSSLYIGCRSGKLLAMRWADINLERGVWTIEVGKNGDPQIIGLSEAALNILKRREKDKGLNPWVFPGGTPYKPSANHLTEPAKAWKSICKKAGVTNLRPHDLRRTMGSYAVMSDASTATVQKLLGHRSIQAAAIYQRVNNSAAKLAADKAITLMQTMAESNTSNNEIKAVG